MTNLKDLISGGRERWAEEYKTLFGLTLSDSDRFFRCLDLYGEFILYEAMVLSSTKKFDKDPLGYILAVAHSKWKDEKKAEMEAERYEMRMQIAKERSLEFNQQLSEKINKARRKMHGSSSSTILR